MDEVHGWHSHENGLLEPQAALAAQAAIWSHPPETFCLSKIWDLYTLLPKQPSLLPKSKVKSPPETRPGISGERSPDYPQYSSQERLEIYEGSRV